MTLEETLAAIAADGTADAGMLMTGIAADYLAASARGDAPVSRWEEPAALAARFDQPLPTGGRPLREVAGRVRDLVVENANWLAHPMAMGHQVSPPLPAAAWADVVTSTLNNSLAVREMSPTLTHVERRVVRWMCDALGFGAGSGGTFTSGGTEATLAALLAARARRFPDVWRDGVGDARAVVLCGAHTHYAVSRAVGVMGLGTRQLIAVPTESHRIDPRALRDRLAALRAEGRVVVAVVATSGQTATGSFDDLDAVADACAEQPAEASDDRGVWLHVDGAHGASAVLSAAHRHRLRGIARADSVAWDPHKMMLTPLASGMLLVRDERALERAFAQQAPYLFQPTEEGVPPDIGVRSLQCSRRGDALKVWVALERYGADGIAALYDHLVALTGALHTRLAAHPRFETLHEPETNILCFRFVGDGSLGEEALDEVNRRLRERYNRSGAGWITATMLDGRRVLRVTIMNPRTTEGHLDRLVEGLDEVGRGM